MLDDGIPVYEQQHAIYNLRTFRFYISKEKYESMKRFTVQNDDLIISCSGTVGRVSIIKDADPKGIISQALLLLRVNEKIIYPLYLKYYLQSKEGYNAIVSRSSGSVQVNISKRNVIEQIPLHLPSVVTQKQIIKILKSLDDKIEINRRINANLEEQASALFKSWFVDFEPFKDGKFIDSELGKIPEGWKVISLNEILAIEKKSISPMKTPKAMFRHYSLPAFDIGKNPEKQLGQDILSNKFVLTDKTTLFSKLNPRIKRIWFVDHALEGSICSSEFIPYKAKDHRFDHFIFSVINSELFYDQAMSLVNGATGSHQRFHPQDTLDFKIVFNEESAVKFDRLMCGILKRQTLNIEESQRLAIIRDTLLPKLMSGEITL